MEYKGPLTQKGLKTYNAPGLGQRVGEAYHISGAVVIPPNSTIVETCGTTGFDEQMKLPKDLIEETMNAFKNIEAHLAAAGVTDGFQSVYSMTSYHVGGLEAHTEALDKATKQYFGSNRPAWAGIGVMELAEGARVEIKVSAILTQQ